MCADYDEQIAIGIQLFVNQSHSARDVDTATAFIFAMQKVVVQKRIELVQDKDIQPDLDLSLDLLGQDIESLLE